MVTESAVTLPVLQTLFDFFQLLAKGDENQSLPARFEEKVFLGLTTTHLAGLEDGQQVLAGRIGEGRDKAFALGVVLHIVWENKDGWLQVK